MRCFTSTWPRPQEASAGCAPPDDWPVFPAREHAPTRSLLAAPPGAVRRTGHWAAASMDGDAESRLCMRPLVVRFTDPQVDDAHENLVYVRQGAGAPRAHAPAEETVRQLKARVRGGGRWPTRVADEQLREREPRLRGRRLRLIHFGRVVADGVRLASWLSLIHI